MPWGLGLMAYNPQQSGVRKPKQEKNSWTGSLACSVKKGYGEGF